MSGRVDRCLHLLSTAGASLAFWLANESAAYSQQAGGGGGKGAYVLPYFVVILSVFLGMLVVCHGSRRRDRAKPEEYAVKSYFGKE